MSLLRESFYVDEFAGGAWNENDAVEVYEKSKEIMNKGDFKLRKWNTNSTNLKRKILEVEAAETSEQLQKSMTIAKEQRTITLEQGDDKQVFRTDPESQTTKVKVLGLVWNVETDQFLQDHTEILNYANSLPPIKRSVLKPTAKIFDPLGLVTPFTI